MSLTKKGSRTITVGNETFLWQIRKKPTYSGSLGWSDLTVAIQLKDTNNSVLIATCGGPRPDSYIKESKEVVITPKNIEEIIKNAISSGWSYNNKGRAFEYVYKNT